MNEAQQMSASPPTPSPTPTLALLGSRGGQAATWLAVLAVLAVQLGAAKPMAAFNAFLVALLSAFVSLVLGLVCLYTSRAHPLARRGAIRGLIFPAVLLVIASVPLIRAGGVPNINDITTDVDHPPRFHHAQKFDANEGVDLEFPSQFGPTIRREYPDLQSVHLEIPMYVAYDRAERAAKRLGWELSVMIPKNGKLEATDTSRVFRFVDDIVVRARADPQGGSIVDIRSRSRDGVGDLGANAARIRAFLSEL